MAQQKTAAQKQRQPSHQEQAVSLARKAATLQQQATALLLEVGADGAWSKIRPLLSDAKPEREFFFGDRAPFGLINLLNGTLKEEHAP